MKYKSSCNITHERHEFQAHDFKCNEGIPGKELRLSYRDAKLTYIHNKESTLLSVMSFIVHTHILGLKLSKTVIYKHTNMVLLYLAYMQR